MPRSRRRLHVIAGRALTGLVVVGMTIWGALALHYCLPGNAPTSALLVGAFSICGLATLCLVALGRRSATALLGFGALFALLLGWWSGIEPSNERDWQPEVARLAHADIDGDQDLDYVVNKVPSLRIFEDDEGRMNRSVDEVGGGVLVVSQFTLYGDCRKGRRPSFVQAMAPEPAAAMVDRFVAALRNQGLEVATGVFGADMKVSLVNDGPVTLLVDSRKEF